MKELTTLALKATYPAINPNNRSFCFEIFGLDFVIDEHFNPWLIEINTNPCLEVPAGCLQRLIPSMLDNSFRIGLDSIFQPTMEYPRTLGSIIPDGILGCNRFELIFDWAFDRDPSW